MQMLQVHTAGNLYAGHRVALYNAEGQLVAELPASEIEKALVVQVTESDVRAFPGSGDPGEISDPPRDAPADDGEIGDQARG